MDGRRASAATPLLASMAAGSVQRTGCKSDPVTCAQV